MTFVPPLPKSAELPVALGMLILKTAELMAKQSQQVFRPTRRRRGGTTLHPGPDTPLWNELRAQLQPHLTKYGEQASLARLLNLPRQRVNEFVTGGGKMPDAERTLQLIAWLIAVQQNRRPS